MGNGQKAMAKQNKENYWPQDAGNNSTHVLTGVTISHNRSDWLEGLHDISGSIIERFKGSHTYGTQVRQNKRRAFIKPQLGIF